MKPPDFPGYIQFFPTLRCNRKCGFCFNRGLTADTEASFNDCKRIIDIISGTGTKEIDLLGGEPTLHPQIISIVDAAIKRGMHPFISSNGSDINTLTTLAEDFSKGPLTIGVSINSNVITDDLRDFIYRHTPVLKGICSSGKAVPDAAHDFIRAGLEYYMLFMDPLSARDIRDCLSFPGFLSVLDNFKSRYSNIGGVYCSGFVQDKGSPLLDNVRCPAGTTKLSVLPDGSVYPCYLFFRHPGYRLGNILTDSFVSIWSSPTLDFFRQFKANNCPNHGCELFSSCHGGCPAVSLLVSNDTCAPDPRCIKK